MMWYEEVSFSHISNQTPNKKMIPFYLITGFLGSGKTTLMKNILKEVGAQKRVAVIQNEFASTGIDGIELKREVPAFKLVEVNNGSVFCVCQLSNFVNSVEQLIEEYKPEVIFLETSGLADPINIAELLQMGSLATKVSLEKVITVVDAKNFFKGLHKLTRCKHQIMISDLLIVNKVDINPEAKTLIVPCVKGINPFVEIVQSTYCRIDIELLWRTSDLNAQKYIGRKSEGRPNVLAVVLRTHTAISNDGLSDFLKDMSAEVIRIKGFVNMKEGGVKAFHSVYEQIEIKNIDDYSGPSEIIAFGEGLSPQYLKEKFNEYSKSFKLNINF